MPKPINSTFGLNFVGDKPEGKPENKPLTEFLRSVMVAVRKLNESDHKLSATGLRQYVNHICELVEATCCFDVTKFLNKAKDCGLVNIEDGILVNELKQPNGKTKKLPQKRKAINKLSGSTKHSRERPKKDKKATTKKAAVKPKKKVSKTAGNIKKNKDEKAKKSTDEKVKNTDEIVKKHKDESVKKHKDENAKKHKDENAKKHKDK